MKFNSVAEAFNYYRNHDVEALEARAQEISNEIDTNAEVDIEAANIELRGIKEARENIELRKAGAGSLQHLSSGTLSGSEKKDFGEDAAATSEYRSAFYKTLQGKKLTDVEERAFAAAQDVERRTAGFNAASDSAAVLPTSTLNEVGKKARTMGGLLAECRAFDMPCKIAIPIGTPGTKAAWHTEGAEENSEKAATTSVVFEGNELIKLFSLSVKTQTMSISAFENYLVEELTACVMETVADSLVNGTGSSQGTGLETISWTGANSVTAAAAAPTYKEVVKTVSLLKRGYAMGAKWAMNNATLYNVFYGMTDKNDRPIFIADPKSEGVGKILGFDVVIDDHIADGDAYLGNFAQYLGYNMPGGITIDVSRESSFRKGLIDYRAMAVADTKPLVAEAFVKLVPFGG